MLTVDGPRLLMNHEPITLQGVSFFNALYNPTFNESDRSRRDWLETFESYGVNMLRVWCQWDFDELRPFVDTGPDQTMYHSDGSIRDESASRLVQLLDVADASDMIVEVTCFSQEKKPNLAPDALERGVEGVTRLIAPYRKVILQIWNEESTEVLRLAEAVRRVDPERLVTSSPGPAGVLGDDEQNRVHDLLTPHTSRRGSDPPWVAAPRELAGLLERWGKPVVDDEPARTGIREHGGPEGGTTPDMHIKQIEAVRQLGAHHVYHHDMFQRSYGHPATPPSGIPDPDFSAYHREVFQYLSDNNVWKK